MTGRASVMRLCPACRVDRVSTREKGESRLLIRSGDLRVWL